MSFPRYPSYKDSGVEWLGQVPAHWEVKPMWTFFRRVKRVGFESEQLLSVYRDYGVIPKASRDDNFNKPSDDLSVYQLVVPGDLAINKMKAWQGSVAVSDYRGIVSPAYFIYEALHDSNRRFLHHLFRSPRYIGGYLSHSKGIRPNQWDLEPEVHSRFPVLVPPPAEQTAIAAFLDRETGKIDELVAEQRRLMELLKEKRQAVISHAVTRGLNPAAPLKPSGIEWLGDVPATWEVKPLKYSITKIEQGWSPQCESEVAAENEWGVLKVGCGNGDRFDPNEQKALPLDIEPLPIYEIKPGDILMSRGNTLELVGSATFVEQVRPRLLLCDLLYRFRAKAERAESEFLVLSLRSPNVRFQIERAATGTSSSMKKIGQGTIREFVIALPPLNEQRAIIAFIKNETAKLDTLTAEAQRAIDLLQERRTALISAAVTGQIDVRGIGA